MKLLVAEGTKMPNCRFLLIFLTLAGFAQSAWAQTTYWLPNVDSSATERTYTYGTRLPDAVGAWLAQRGKTATRGTSGGQRKFVEVTVNWDSNGGANPMGGMISAHSPKGVGQDWMPFSDKMKGDIFTAAAFDSAIVTEFKTWRVADLFVLVSQGDANPNVTLKIAISPEDQIRARMRALAKSTAPGQFYKCQTDGCAEFYKCQTGGCPEPYKCQTAECKAGFPNKADYPEVTIPADLDAMRREIVALGNLGRRDPNYRSKNTNARDLTGEKASTGGRTLETIYRNNQTPPYFNDLVLHPKLNEACQFMAEYYALANGNKLMPDGRKHDAPGQIWNGAKMDKYEDRVAYFAPNVGTAGEGLAGAGGADDAPTTWMTSETHYRPWFNIGHDVKSMGIGAARTKDGWYFCKIGGTDLPGAAGVQPVSPPVIQTQTGGQGTSSPATNPSTTPPQASGASFPLRAGTKIEQNRSYRSESGGHYLVFQPDGNVAVYTAANKHVWSLDMVTRNFSQAKDVQVQSDGNFVVYGANKSYIWSALAKNPDPSAYLTMAPEGALRLVSGNTGATLWASDKNLAPVYPATGSTAGGSSGTVQPAPKPRPAIVTLERGKQYAIRGADGTFRYAQWTRQRGPKLWFSTCPGPASSDDLPMTSDDLDKVIRVEDALAQGLFPTGGPCDVNQTPFYK